MLVSLQFPIADLRPFVTAPTNRLGVPGWPDPTPSDQFVRGFGVIRPRRLGGFQGWINEDKVCIAKRAMTFVDFHRLDLPSARIAFKRLYSDGECTTKYDVGIRFPGKRIYDLHLLVGRILDLTVGFRAGRAARPLLAARAQLAGAYLAASTRTSDGFTPDSGWIKAGRPLVFSESDREAPTIPHFATRVDLWPQWSIRMAFWEGSYKGQSLPIWHIHHNNKALARNLRASLTRLHAEMECLNAVLDAIGNGRIAVDEPQVAERVQRYLSDAITRVTRTREKGPFGEEAWLQLARQVEEKLQPGRYDAIMAKCNLFRKNVKNKIAIYTQAIEKERFGGSISFVNCEVTMSNDTYNNIGGQVGAMGNNAKVENSTFNQLMMEQIDPGRLAEELKKLKAALSAMTLDSDQAIDLVLVERAADAAERQDVAQASGFLKRVGGWMADVAKDVGAEIAVKLITGGMG